MNSSLNSDESVSSASKSDSFSGAGLGLPDQGSGSLAPIPLRFLSTCIDWAAAAAVSAAVFHYDPLATLLLFLAQIILMQTLFGASIGQFVTSLRVLPITGRSPMIARAVVRSAVMLSIISAFVMNDNRQTLHDLVAGVVVVRA